MSETSVSGLGHYFLVLIFFCLVGAPIAGRLSDRMVIKWRKKRNGEWVPEDRLRAAILGSGIFVPMSLIICGLVTTLVPGTLGIVLNLAAFLMNGLGVSVSCDTR